MTLRLTIDKPLNRFGYLALIASGCAAAVFVTLLIFGFDQLTSGYYHALLLSMGVSLILTIGFQIFSGNTGIVSFGHPAFVAIGAYVAGIASVPPAMKNVMLPDLPAFLATTETGLFVGVLLGGVIAAVFAFLVGVIVMRLTGVAAGIMTFSFLVIVNELIRNSPSFTRGNQTFFGVPKLTDFTSIYATVILVVAISLAFKFSAAGLRARAAREDTLAAETTGINQLRSRLWPWVVSAFVMGCGGALMAYTLTAFSPKSFYTTLIIPMLIMSILGGVHSIAGAVVGTILITTWGQLMRLVEDGDLWLSLPPGSSQMTLGIMLVVVLYFWPNGLLGSKEFLIGPRKNSNPKPKK